MGDSVTMLRSPHLRSAVRASGWWGNPETHGFALQRLSQRMALGLTPEPPFANVTLQGCKSEGRLRCEIGRVLSPPMPSRALAKRFGEAFAGPCRCGLID